MIQAIDSYSSILCFDYIMPYLCVQPATPFGDPTSLHQSLSTVFLDISQPGCGQKLRSLALMQLTRAERWISETLFIHFPCRYFRTICAFSIFFTCFQSLSLVVKNQKNATAVGMIQLSARTQASCVRDYIFERCLAVPFPCCDSACLSPLNHR